MWQFSFEALSARRRHGASDRTLRGDGYQQMAACVGGSRKRRQVERGGAFGDFAASIEGGAVALAGKGTVRLGREFATAVGTVAGKGQQFSFSTDEEKAQVEISAVESV